MKSINKKLLLLRPKPTKHWATIIEQWVLRSKVASKIYPLESIVYGGLPNEIYK